MKLFIVTVSLVLAASCSPSFYQQRQKVNGTTEVFNYEYTNTYYVSELRNTHFTVNVLIVEPYIASFPQKDFGRVYAAADIDAVAICDVTIRADGSVANYDIRKKAGLGLDKYTRDLISSMKFKPLTHKGVDHPAKFRVVLHYTK